MQNILKCAVLAAALLSSGCATLTGVPLGAGDWVLAKWQPEDPNFYPGVITSRSGDQLAIQYDDGDTGTQHITAVRRFDWRAGTHLQCRWSDGNFYPATITEMGANRVDMRVRYDDGDRQDTTSSACRDH